MATPISRRTFLAGSAGAIGLVGAYPLIFGRQSTVPDLVALPMAVPLPVAIAQTGLGSDLPALTVTAAAGGFRVSEAEIPAGRYAVTFNNQTESELSAAFMLIPDGLTIDDLDDALDAALTEEAPPPEWYFTAKAAGGLSAPPGTIARFVVELPPGDYAVHPDTPVKGIGAMPLSVTGDMPADLPSVESDVSVGMTEMAFQVEGELRAGAQVIKLTNTGSQQHLVNIFSVPDGTTIEDWDATVANLMQGPEATSAEGALAFSDLVPVVATSPQSSRTTMWATIELGPGTLLLLCSVFDTETGAPHAAMGMAEIVDIA